MSRNHDSRWAAEMVKGMPPVRYLLTINEAVEIMRLSDPLY